MSITRLKRIEKRRKRINFILLLTGLGILICMFIFVGRLWGFYKSIHTESKTPTTKTQKKVEEKTEYTFLVLGYGGGKHEGTYLTDTIMVANINLKSKKVVLVSIPRDIWVKVPTKEGAEDFHSKINAVYQMGLFPKNYPAVDKSFLTKDNPSGLIKEVVKNITDLPVDAYFAVDFEGFVRVIDILGGIDVQVKRTFTDYEYPIEGKEDDPCDKKDQELEDAIKQATQEPVLAFPCRYETLHFDSGETHLDGATALKYARSRHALDDGGDYNRARRQQNVIEAVKGKVLNIGFIPKIIPLLNELEDHITIDLDLADINKLLLEARNADQYTVDTLVIAGDYLTDTYSDFGQYISIPRSGIDDWSEVQKTVKNMRLGITPTTTPDPSRKLSPTRVK